MSRELATFRKPEDRFRILQQINAILSQLDKLSADYVDNDIAVQFRTGSDAALADLRKLKLSLSAQFLPKLTTRVLYPDMLRMVWSLAE